MGNRRSQAAEMVLAPGESSEPGGNSHRGSDQWLYVVQGKAEAIVNGKNIQLKKRSLLLIEKNEKHEIINSGKTPFKTLNFYVPPAYTKDGHTLPRGRS
ncbi:MAG: cupin domain-containing protein [Candidatus Omnitrophica bacterium]|nr:cupin domain-containing protein [Candidatus Omnitrophota bacterium]